METMERKWQALGRALKTLRLARDLGQKEVGDRLGEQMGERSLRGYETGELRPSRDRLIRLLVSSYEVKSRAEINRYLEVAEYATLQDSESSRYGVTGSTFAADGNGANRSAGAPTAFRVEVSTLIASDGQGREVWRHEFPTPLTADAYQGCDAVKRCAFADIDGDGSVETLFVHVPLNFASVGSTLICFAADGSIRWQFAPGKVVWDTTPRRYGLPYYISNVQVIPMPESEPQILVSSNHYLHNANQVAMLDANGKLISEYWHTGHLLSVVHADLNDDGVNEILLAGVNNGYRQATMVVFDPRSVSGCSHQPRRRIRGFPRGTEKAVVLFPKTCLSKNSPYNRVATLWITTERHIALAVVEGVSEARNPGVMVYELDFTLRVVNARPDSHLQESHRVLELQGTLDHSWTEEENQRLRREVMVIGGL